jgi:hypothetical protein
VTNQTNSSSNAPFVTQLRARPGVITVGTPEAENVFHLRVEMPEVWDVVRIDASPNEPVLAIKVHALQALAPGALFHDDYFIKLRGHEIFDETKSLQEVGAKDGSIFVLTNRNRRPVR